MALFTTDAGVKSNVQAVHAAVTARSAFQQAARQVPISITGDNTFVTGVDLTLETVGEGTQKPVGGELQKFTLSPSKIAGLITVSEELEGTVDIAGLLESSAPQKLSRQFDLRVAAGTLGNLDDIDTVGIEGWNDFHTLFGNINIDGIVASSAFASAVLGMRDASGREYLPQTTGLQSILGAPVYVFRDSTPVAYAGAWDEQSAWGVAVPQGGILKRYDQAVIDGVNLAETNMVGYRVEAFYGFGVNPSAFRKLTLTTEDEGTGEEGTG